MRHHGKIAGVELEADHDFIVYGHSLGLLSECANLTEARDILRQKHAESKERNTPDDLAIYRWQDERWVPAVSLYEMQENDFERNPGVFVHFP